MLEIRIILSIACIVFTAFSRLAKSVGYIETGFKPTPKSKISAVLFWFLVTISIATGFIFLVLSTIAFFEERNFLNWCIPTIFVFFESIALFDDIEIAFGCIKISLVIGVFSIILATPDYFTKCNEEHITISTVEILSVTDETMVEGNFSGRGFLIYNVSSSINENPIYRYYYELEDGGIKLGEIPAKSTTIYYLRENQPPYVEIIENIPCRGYYTQSGKHSLHQYAATTAYKLYVPEGSILNVFQFDEN